MLRYRFPSGCMFHWSDGSPCATPTAGSGYQISRVLITAKDAKSHPLGLPDEWNLWLDNGRVDYFHVLGCRYLNNFAKEAAAIISGLYTVADPERLKAALEIRSEIFCDKRFQTLLNHAQDWRVLYYDTQDGEVVLRGR